MNTLQLLQFLDKQIQELEAFKQNLVQELSPEQVNYLEQELEPFYLSDLDWETVTSGYIFDEEWNDCVYGHIKRQDITDNDTPITN